MASFKSFYDRKHYCHLDLPPGNEQDSETVVTIAEVKQGTLKNAGGTEDKVPFLVFEGQPKPFGCNKTNAKVIAAMYGEDTDGWAGKAVTLFRTEVEFQGDRVAAIRIRSTPPRRLAKAAPAKRKRAA